MSDSITNLSKASPLAISSSCAMGNSTKSITLSQPDSLFSLARTVDMLQDLSVSPGPTFSASLGPAPIAAHRFLTADPFQDVTSLLRPPTSALSYLSAKPAVVTSSVERLADQVRKNDEEITRLRSSLQQRERDLSKKSDELSKTQLDANALKVEGEQKQRDLDLLTKKQRIHQFVSRVSDDALENLMNDGILATEFTKNELQSAFVMSVDIRRSTELMLKARKPDLFAEFITELCEAMREAVVTNYGVFDKFTGDGILAFFPEFYSGEDAGLSCLAAAKACHDIFKDIYLQHRSCFSSVLLDVGLGIGIDYGLVQIVQVGREITVVGVPVVYACRLGGAPTGATLLNQPAFEVMHQRYRSQARCVEDRMPIKHEGDMLAYRAELIDGTGAARKPSWVTASTSKPS